MRPHDELLHAVVDVSGAGAPSPAPATPAPAGPPLTDPAPIPAPAAPPPPAPAPAAPTDWRAGLPEDLRAAPALKDTKDVGSLAKQFVDLQAHLGNSVRIPGKDAGAQDIESFHKKLVEHVPGLYYFPKEGDPQAMEALLQKMGKPATGAEYEVAVPKGAEEIPGFRDTAHKLGLTRGQVKQLTDWWSGYQMGEVEKAQQAHYDQMHHLDAEWGAAKQSKVNSITALATKTGAPPDIIEALKSGTVAAASLRWLDNLVKAIGTEGVALAKDSQNAPGLPTPKEAELQIDEIMRRKEYRELGPLGESLREKVNELAKLAWKDE